MVQLTESIIKSKTKTDKLSEVRNLNLWGQDITDVCILQHTPNVEILSLSVNGITSLRQFMHCKELKELYLRKNNVTSLSDIRYLMPLPHLKVLWLSDNPCAELANYRSVVVANLPQLEKLDNIEVTQADRLAATGVVLLQPATAAELAADEEHDSAAVGSAGSIFDRHAIQQHLKTASFGHPDWAHMPAAAAAGGPAAAKAAAANARSVGQVAVSGGEGHRYAATIDMAVPCKAGAADGCPGSSEASGTGAGAAASEVLPQHRQLYNPQRYSSQPGNQAMLPEAKALLTDEVLTHNYKLAVVDTHCQQQQQLQHQHISLPGPTGGSRALPTAGSANVLYAVMALLADLDVSQLAIVQKEVEQRLAQA